ncbi:MAG: NAD(P)/FAD-dependent oxidoreductase [Microlunatus sp.]|nr:NAD(P)/FAD-dependent oxidoreductase [Microlunatus sp.]
MVTVPEKLDPHEASGLPREADAVVIGTGPNGLVAANRLADAGWEVLLLEEQTEIGGSVRSDRDVHPDFVHDTFSAFYPMAAASPVMAGLGLAEHGLRWRHAPAVLGHPWPDGSWSILHRDLDVTAGLLDAESAGDGAAWRTLGRDWRRVGPGLLDALLSPMPPVRGALRTALALPRVGGLDFVRRLLTPARHVLDAPVRGHRFAGRSAPMLVQGNACHSDIGLDAAGSGFLGLLLSLLAQTVGFPVPEGGAGRLSAALHSRLAARGGRTVTGARVDRVVLDRGRAVGVVVDDTVVRARRAVVADVGAEQLFGRLLRPEDVPSEFLARLSAFRMDPATVKVDFALDRPVPWASAPPYAPGTVHIADSPTELGITGAQIAAGLIPDRPFLLVGQMTTSDPGRSPGGTESLWAYSHVPQRVTGDAAGQLTGDWDGGDSDRFADRMQARLESYAPGFSATVLARRVLGPPDLQRRNANLVGGAVGGGSASLDQQLVFRPTTGNGRASTPVQGLFLGSASAHPGGSVHGACGMNAARAALWQARFGGRREFSNGKRSRVPGN